MSEKTDVWQGTLALMVLKTLEALGPLHGYGIARRIDISVSANEDIPKSSSFELHEEGIVFS